MSPQHRGGSAAEIGSGYFLAVFSIASATLGVQWGRGRRVSEPLWVSSAGKGAAVPVVISTSRDLANTHFRTPLITESESFIYLFLLKSPA